MGSPHGVSPCPVRTRHGMWVQQSGPTPCRSGSQSPPPWCCRPPPATTTTTVIVIGTTSRLPPPPPARATITSSTIPSGSASSRVSRSAAACAAPSWAWLAHRGGQSADALSALAAPWKGSVCVCVCVCVWGEGLQEEDRLTGRACAPRTARSGHAASRSSRAAGRAARQSQWTAMVGRGRRHCAAVQFPDAAGERGQSRGSRT